MPLSTLFNFKTIAAVVALVGIALICARVSYSLHPVEFPEQLPAGLVWITPAEANSPNYIWVDARSPHMYQRGHIPGAFNLTLVNYDERFLAFANLWRPWKTIIVYCDGGGCQLSSQVGERLKKSIPDAQIKILKGGYPAWLQK